MIDFDSVTSLPDMFFQQVEQSSERPFLWAKQDDGWNPKTWRECGDETRALADGLTSLGVKPGDRVCLVAENRPEWLIADVAIMTAGAATVPSYTTNTTANHLHVFNDSGAKVAIVSTAALAAKVIPAAVESGIDLVITMEPPAEIPQQGVVVKPWQEVLEAGRAAPGNLTAQLGAMTRKDMCCIIYTSGTGGTPTGVMLSHGSIISNAKGAEHVLQELDGYRGEDEVFLSFLPLSHSYEHTAGQFVPVAIGAQIYFAESLEKLVGNIADVRPTIMTAVPRLYETIRGRVLSGAAKAGGLKEKLLHRAIELGSKAYEDPASLSLGERLFNKLLDKLVRKKVQDRFGGRLKAFISGGAPLNYDVGLFFLALKVRILQGYGQTESGPVISVNRAPLNKLHTVGPPLLDVECKIAADGEILVRGELVMLGYWNKPDRSAQTVIDDWLHTGDVGELDADGYLRITDRKKDIIVNSGGDNISPQRVEGVLCVEPEVGQAMVYGDQKPHLIALIVPDEEFARNWRRENGVGEDEPLSGNDAFAKVMRDVLDRSNSKLSVIEKVRRAVVADEAFSIENGMMTPSMKIRRHIIKEEYGARLESLYK